MSGPSNAIGGGTSASTFLELPSRHAHPTGSDGPDQDRHYCAGGQLIVPTNEPVGAA